jgi:hypothetical protein
MSHSDSGNRHFPYAAFQIARRISDIQKRIDTLVANRRRQKIDEEELMLLRIAQVENRLSLALLDDCVM